jgi:hypothetical protein
MGRKFARFHELVKQFGKPQPVTLWAKPEENRAFMKAVRENRVLTVSQPPKGTKKDFGQIGFHLQPSASYLVFPRPLHKDAQLRVVGIKYDELEQPRARVGVKGKAPKSARAPAPKRVPVEKEFQVMIRRVATLEVTETVTASDFQDAQSQALKAVTRRAFDVKNADIADEVKTIKES